MENIKQVNNKYYFISKYIKVFPSAYRSPEQDKFAAFNIEDNLRRLSGVRRLPSENNEGGYVYSWINDIIEFSIAGYYFAAKINLKDISANTEVYAKLTLENISVADNNNFSVPKRIALPSAPKNATVLDLTDSDGVSYFTGLELCFDVRPKSTASEDSYILKLLEKIDNVWKIPAESGLPKFKSSPDGLTLEDNLKVTDLKATDKIAAKDLIVKNNVLAKSCFIGIDESTLTSVADGTLISNSTIEASTQIDASGINTVHLTAETQTTPSDLRLKENIEDYSPTDSILKLPVKKFIFKNSKKEQIGCIAQDLQKICPDIVEKTADGYLTIQENKLIYLLLIEVKKLKAELDEIKNRLN